MADIPMLTEAAFESEVIKSSLPVMVDFTALWCGPCKMMDPVVTQLSKEWGDKVKVFKLDADENTNLVTRYGVMSLPTLILFVDGKPVQRLSGYQPKDRIQSNFSAYF
jgi:thioredoxin 1